LNKRSSHDSRGLDGAGTLEACDIPQDRYRVFIQDVADAFFETNIQGDFVFFNDALCRIFGHSREEIERQNFRHFMDSSNAEYAFDSFNKMFETGKGVNNILWEISRKDGGTRILEINANLLEDTNGTKVGFQGIARDVTDKVNAERALKTSEKRAQEQYIASRMAEQRYRSFMKFLPFPVFVFNMDGTVSYLNPAFEKTFGWTLDELKGKQISFVPDDQKKKTRLGIQQLLENKKITGFETQRLTKDGKLLDIVLDGAIFYDKNNQPAGQVVTLQDVTQENRGARINQALFRIAQALYQFRGLDERLQFIAKEVKELIDGSGAMVILVDHKTEEFFFREAAFESEITGQKIKEIRFPLNKGVAGEVYRTGKPLIVNNTSDSPHFFKQVDDQAGMQTHSMLDVPIHIEDRMIGVLCIVNKRGGPFDQTDVDLMSAIANMVALPIENARINEALRKSYENVTNLNRAKDRVIHHLSHELKTPVSVLSASLNLLKKRYQGPDSTGLSKILDRAERNLNRILDMQYKIEDIMDRRDYRSHRMLSSLLDVCQDELEAMVADEVGSERFTDRLRQRMDSLFGPRNMISEEIKPGSFLLNLFELLRPRFAHRSFDIETRFDPTEAILIPPEVLTKIAEGLIRNAIENTPDGGRIVISLTQGSKGPEFLVQDFGVGISEDNQRLIFENYFTAYETSQYASRKPYDFNAGGKGFDLIRIRIFSERYHFKLKMSSKRCPHLADDQDSGPGSIAACEYCKKDVDCLSSGTTMRVLFQSSKDYGNITQKKVGAAADG
jgi:PAS domain S-box-containing protein